MKLRILFYLIVSLSVTASYAADNVTTNNQTPNAAPSTTTNNNNAVASQQQEKRIWNLQNADIMQVIAEVSRETGKNFIISPKVKGNVTIISKQPLSANEIYPVFLSTLQTLGFAAVPSGKLIKIVPLADGNQISSIFRDGAAKDSDGIVVKVIRLHYVTATQLVPILYPLIPSWAKVSAYGPADAVIISGTADIVNRISGIVERVDTPEANGIEVIHLRYATAEDVAKEVEKLQQVSRLTSGDMGASVTADDRSNSVMISGNQGTRLRMKVMVAQLDTPSIDGSSDTQVVYLHYKSVQSVLPVLRGVANQSVGSSQVTNTAATASFGSSNNTSYGASNNGSSNSTNVPLIEQVTNAQINSGGGDAKSHVVIVGDVPNNAIVITAPPNLMRRLKSVIYQLDIRPKQVLIQGVIAEVNASRLSDLGVEWGSSETKSLPGTPNAIPFLASGGVGVGVLRYSGIANVIQALSTDGNTNILSTPSVMVKDNGTATIQVGQSVPVKVGSLTSVNNSDTTGSNIADTFNYRDIGLTLNVIPQITDDNSVNLRIVQSNSNIQNTATAGVSSAAGTDNPTFSQEQLKTASLVKNSQILVLGGLMSSQEETTVKKVPILGDIPLLGRLFQHHETNSFKRVLVIFLRPVIVDGPAQAQQLSNAKYNWFRHNAQMSTDGKNPIAGSSIPPSLTPDALPVPFSDSQ